MNESYLFRGKGKHTGKWITGSLICSNEGRYISYGGWGLATISFCSHKDEIRVLVEEVDPATIGQCTGLRDKGGKLIFEGDILTRIGRNVKRRYVVEWNMYYWALNDNRIESSLLMNAGDLHDQVIIGNRWDNPELLKEAE